MTTARAASKIKQETITVVIRWRFDLSLKNYKTRYFIPLIAY